MLRSERLQCDLQLNCRAAVDGNKLIVLQLDDISVCLCNDTGNLCQLTRLIRKLYRYGKDPVPQSSL